MDLPPSSYHYSLEELWDEEEEPEEVETLMKVVPSVYHQYLDVFSKVKAEKLPPHHACDHHIELEGSLPPVILFLLKASRWTKQKSNKFSIGHLQETSIIFNSSLALTISTAISLRIIQRKSVHSPVSSRKIPVSPSMSNLLVSDSGKHPIGFDSRKLIPAELNYGIHDKEHLGIVWALKRWRAFLLSLSSPFEALTNNSSLQCFMSSKVLTFATLPDALSHWDNVYLERGEAFISNNPMNFQQLIKQDEVQPLRFFAVKVEYFSNWIESIQKKLWQDSQYRSIHQELGKGKSVQEYSLDTSSQLHLFKDMAVVPNNPMIQLRIHQKPHESPLAGHPCQVKTLNIVKQDFHWSCITQFIKDYVSSCQQCSRNKNIHHKKHQEPPPPIVIEEEEEWEVSQIPDSKIKRGKLWYFVEWKGFSQDPERSTWEPTQSLNNCPEHLKDFHSLYPDKPGPNSSRGLSIMVLCGERN
ncbi:hypothetical protein O181_049101 [Austropuccinia psidii MF-1]|uniref:Chromo domain-containing protein n=1 Tax=Austropuccinia psidii MF-1 TaxID=1389203 RepID=A0A9Q3DRT5_9BASI|nr:hypothetical protein [Austropuccinia psidii MF-1]